MRGGEPLPASERILRCSSSTRQPAAVAWAHASACLPVPRLVAACVGVGPLGCPTSPPAALLRSALIRVASAAMPQRRNAPSFFGPGPLGPRPRLAWVARKASRLPRLPRAAWSPVVAPAEARCALARRTSSAAAAVASGPGRRSHAEGGPALPVPLPPRARLPFGARAALHVRASPFFARL